MAILASNLMSASRKWNCLVVCEQESFRRADARRLDSCDKLRNEDGKVSANLLSKRCHAKGNSAFASRDREHSAREGCQAYHKFPHSCACHRNPATRSPSRERTFHIRQSEQQPSSEPKPLAGLVQYRRTETRNHAALPIRAKVVELLFPAIRLQHGSADHHRLDPERGH